MNQRKRGLMNMKDRGKKLIMVTNDDGYQSPGLLAAAHALSPLGDLVIAAPRGQQTFAGRSLPRDSDGLIEEFSMTFQGETRTVFAVGGSPAQAVRHGVLELLPGPPDLLVSGINYGENVGTCVTMSGTIGAALEGAALGIPSLAVSLQVETEHNFSHSADIDFSAAAHFTRFFASMLLEWKTLKKSPGFNDVDVLKVEVPSSAAPDTPWCVTSLSRTYYYYPDKKRSSGEQPSPGPIGYRIRFDSREVERGSDLHALRALQQVAVTPLSIDMTSRVDLSLLQQLLLERAGQ
jgi:5'-nucleotidase